MTSSSPATLDQRLGQHEVWLYVALDTIDEIAKRVGNIVTGRDLTVVRQYVGEAGRSFPDVQTGLRVDPRGRGGGIEVSKQPEYNHCGLTVFLTPGLRAFGISGSYATEKETAETFHAANDEKIDLHKRWTLQGNTITFVHIVGGQTPGEVGDSTVIEILRTNENWVQEQIIVKPRIVRLRDVADAEAAVLDRVAEHVESSGAPLTGEQARDLATYARENWQTGLSA